ncbi:MBL fold metallo-hydrolase [Treponema rectale]|jgi:metallo-beta-lactamase family protein|uniref:MBL fold metallo-hydrolase n=1 Tax=Treponema rectale TaxID=744512 RepID=A0A840SDZ3_9SPIR|nr:MBL fold metallo-hydrolase [Treponema rectale]MBB5219094.1 metallo-beta-lactamase family protein [Treponema rectale]QOS41004.1 MBL fold metallo-hydrolase [Treponema rectale]
MAVISYSLGAAQEVTGSKHILEIDGRSFMIDCGAFQGKRSESDEKNRNFDFAPDKIESVVLTHAHYDHCGLLPVLTKNGYGGNIYATPATRDLANIVMMDSARIQARDAEFLAKQAAKKGEKFSWKPLFTEKDCVKAADQIITLSYNRKMFIAPDVQLEFFDAGHILGSSLAYFTITGQRKNHLSGKASGGMGTSRRRLWHRIFGINPDKRGRDQAQEEEALKGAPSDEIRVLYTGDLGRKCKPIIRDPAVEFPAPDYIFMESTYGNRLHEPSSVAMEDLEKIVRRAVDQKGKIIIPSFAIERAQEILYYLHLLVDQKKIPQIPVYMDSPMAVNATGIFQLHQECYDEKTKQAFLQHHKNPFGWNSMQFVQSVDESKELNKKQGPMIIISADGMCEAGRILYHLANNINNPKNIILLVGYMSENTLGRRIRDGEKEVKILGDWYNVKAQVETINAFSAHADYQESLDWLNEIDTSRLKKIFLVHGEHDAQLFMKDFLEKNGYPNVEIVKYGESYELK